MSPESSVQKEVDVNILLLGETGVGKSTFINSFANYLFYPKIEDAQAAEQLMCPINSSFTVTDMDYVEKTVIVGTPSTNEDVTGSGKSSTQGCRCYKFAVPHGNKIVNLRLIDTPGVGDTRGYTQDNKNFDDILRHLMLYSHLNAICILLSSNLSRVTLAFRYCVKELLKHLHKSAQHNILFFFTNSRSTLYKPGESLPTLRALLTELQATEGIHIPLSKGNMFCFDNEAFRFLSALRVGITFEETDAEAFKTSWTRAYEENYRLLTRIVELPYHNLTDTISLNQARKFLVQLAHPMAAVMKANTVNMNILKNEVEKLKQIELSVSDLAKRITVIRLHPVPVQLEFPRTVCSLHKRHHGETTIYTEICHERCYITGVPTTVINRAELQQCSAMVQGECKRGSCGHSWDMHMHITYDIKFEKQEVIDHAVSNEIALKKNQKEIQHGIIAKRQTEIHELTQEHKLMLDILAKFASFLKDNAIVKVNDAMKDYLEMQLQDERDKAQLGGNNKAIITALENDLRRYDEEVAAFALHSQRGEGPCTLESFPHLVKQLYELKHNGKVIEGLSIGAQVAADSHSINALQGVTVSFTAPTSFASALGLIDKLVQKL